MNLVPPPTEMRRAFLAADASFDGLFVAGVRTTGIFCRPSCSARKPKIENLEFFSSPTEAAEAGYRPCLRCRPNEASGGAPEWIQPLLVRLEAAPNDRLTESDLRTLGLEPARVRRWFTENRGVTFSAWCRQRRLDRAHSRLDDGANLDEVALDHGFESHSGFREAFTRVFGEAPGRARGGDRIVTGVIESPVGPLVVGACDAGLCLLEFGDPRRLERQLEALRRRHTCAVVAGEHPLLKRLERELMEYFAGQRRQFEVPLASRGSDFQERVWTELRRIPYGETISYEELAIRIERPGAQRAVGLANGSNRIAIVIPCHRVVNKSGELGGYGGGLWRKRLLLEMEKTGQGLTGSNSQ